MGEVTETKVIIAGREYTISGYESKEYQHRVAEYVNEKMAECADNPSFSKLPQDRQLVFMLLNVADDLFKALEDIVSLRESLDSKTQELQKAKHNIATNLVRLDNSEKEKDALKAEIANKEKEIVRLETKLN